MDRCEAPLAVLSLALPDHSQRDRFSSLRCGYITVSLPEDADGSKMTTDFQRRHIPRTREKDTSMKNIERIVESMLAMLPVDPTR